MPVVGSVHRWCNHVKRYPPCRAPHRVVGAEVGDAGGVLALRARRQKFCCPAPPRSAPPSQTRAARSARSMVMCSIVITCIMSQSPMRANALDMACVATARAYQPVSCQYVSCKDMPADGDEGSCMALQQQRHRIERIEVTGTQHMHKLDSMSVREFPSSSEVTW